MVGPDDGAHGGVRLGYRTYRQRAHGLGQPVDEAVGPRLDGEHDAAGEAAFSGLAKGAREDGRNGAVEVRVRDDQDVVLRAREGLHPLPVRGGGGVDVVGGRGGSDEGNRVDPRVGEERVDRGRIAVDEVERSRRKPRFRDQPSEEGRGKRNALGRLQDEAVAADEGQWPHPERDHHREVEGGDAGHDPYRLAEERRVHSGRDVLEEVALHRRGGRRGELRRLDPPPDLALGLIPRLAVLSGYRTRELVRMRFEEAPKG